MPPQTSFPDDIDAVFSSNKGTRIALVFALVAERLQAHYEHDCWLTDRQGATLAAEWLARNRRNLPLSERAYLAEVSGQLARSIATSLSREAGLLTTHEMMESLAANRLSFVAQTIMEQCEQALAE